VVAPTRELAKQIGKQLFKFTKHSEKIFVEVLTGGDNLDRQIAALQRPTHIVVVTPGRLHDLLERGALTLAHVRFLILDEADEMLKMGFQRELARIFDLTAARESAWLFSATIPKGIKNLIANYMSPQAHLLKIDQQQVVNKDIAHQFIMCHRNQRLDRLVDFLKRRPEERGVIFCRTIVSADTMAKQLDERGFSVELLHGEMMQTERDKVMRAFKKSRAQLLIATDVAARGIDVEGLAFVVHCQLPDQIEYYTHRSGRTGRAGNKGISLAFIEPGEKASLIRLAEELNLNFRELR
jgi:ATP-dependent RNA helicase DeaD